MQRSRGGPTPGELEGGKGGGRGREGYSKIANLVLVSGTHSLEQRNRAGLRRVPLAAVSEGKGGGRKAREENPQSWGLGGGQSQNTLSQQVKPHPCSRSRAAVGTRRLSSEVSLPARPPPPQPLETVTLDWTRSCGFRKYSSQHWTGGLSLPGTPAHALIEDPCRTCLPLPRHTPRIFIRALLSPYGTQLFMCGSFKNGTRSAWASSTWQQEAADAQPTLAAAV